MARIIHLIVTIVCGTVLCLIVLWKKQHYFCSKYFFFLKMLYFLSLAEIYMSPVKVFSVLSPDTDLSKGYCTSLRSYAASFSALRIFKYTLLFNDLSFTGLPYVEIFFIYSLIKLNHISSASSSIKMNWTD